MAKNDKIRQKEYIDKKKQQGLVRIAVWIPEKHRTELKEKIKKLIASYDR
jgi:hypothetical protein